MGVLLRTPVMQKRACRLDLDILGVLGCTYIRTTFHGLLVDFSRATSRSTKFSKTQRMVRNIPQQLLAVTKSFVFVTPSQFVVVVRLAGGGGRNERGEKSVARFASSVLLLMKW
jgi:hypothetical protein